MRKPEAATVVLPVETPDMGVRTVVRDLTIAAYALRSRGIALRLLAMDTGDGAAAKFIEQLVQDTPLRVSVAAGPKNDPARAYLDGFERVLASGDSDLVVTLDANGRHDATQIPRLVDGLIDQDADVVIGSRWTRGSGTPGLTVRRWVLGRLANLAFRIVTGVRGVRDATTSFRVCRVETLREFGFDGMPLSSHSVQTAFVATAVARGYRVVEAPIIYHPPAIGTGGLTPRDIAAFVSHLRALRELVDDLRHARLTPAGRSFNDDHFGAADDLERLGTARHFFEWVLEEFDPWLESRLLEVGAGAGTITRKLHDRHPGATIVALEPAHNMFEDLEPLAAMSPRVEARRETLATYTPDEPFDAVMYLNVLEHIADDDAEVRMAADVLRPGGALLVFGPALEWLYSELDHKAGHYRRYTTRRLRRIVEAAGFEIISLRYFDVLGVLPYWLVYRLLRHTEITGGSLWGYDRLVVPLSRAIQRVMPHPPVGKNVILVARRG